MNNALSGCHPRKVPAFLGCYLPCLTSWVHTGLPSSLGKVLALRRHAGAAAAQRLFLWLVKQHETSVLAESLSLSHDGTIIRYNQWEPPWAPALLQLGKLVIVLFYSQDAHKPLTHGDVAKKLVPHVQWTFLWQHPKNYLEKRHVLTSSIDLDHQHTKPTALQDNKDIYSSLEHIFTNQTYIFWY